MHKDFKIGLFAGIAIAVATTVWLCTLPRLSTVARAMQTTADKTPAVSKVEPPLVVSAVEPIESSSAAPLNHHTERSDGPASESSIINESSRSLVKRDQQSSRIHVVQKGDTLSKIAEKYYGSPRSWPKIVAANRDTLPDPNRLTPGTKLLIP